MVSANEKCGGSWCSFKSRRCSPFSRSPILADTNRYVTNTAFTSIPATQFEYPNNRLVNSNYDVLYRRKQIIEQATSSVIATWQFYGPGRIAEVVLANGITQSFLNNARTNSSVQSNVANPPWGDNSSDRLGYDGAGRNITKRYVSSTLNAQNGYANTTAIVGNTTAYDRAGNKFYERALQADERDNLYQPVDSSGDIASPVPGYDSINRLLQYQRGTLNSTGGYQSSGGGSVTTAITLPSTDQSRNYTLDGLGNWKTSVYTPVGGSATTDQRNHNYVNEITQRTLTGGSPVMFQYDGATGASNGNLTNDGRLIYAYDAYNRLIQVNRVSDGLIIATYVYDAMNRRVRKTIFNGGLTGTIPNGTTDYIWAGWLCMEERNSSDAPIRLYIWGTYIDECIQFTTLTALGPQSLPAGIYYLLQDLLYRAVALTNSSGAIVEAYDTDAYGNTLIFTGPGTDGVWFTDDDVQSSYGANEIIYCGYRFDPETQLYYVRNRSYNAALGRWIQKDPIGYQGGINLYEYVGGRGPTTADGTGLAAIPTTVPGLLRSMLGHRGHFYGTLSRQTNTSSYLSLSFTPSAEGKKCCDEIEFMQFYQEAWCRMNPIHLFGWPPFFQCHSTNGWVLDDVPAPNSPARVPPPFYPYQFPWTKPIGSASMTDNPGFSHVLFLTNYTFFSQQFATFAVCTRGKEAGHAYGEELWGHVFHLVQWINHPLGHSTVMRNLEGAAPPTATGELGQSMSLTIR